MNYDFDGIKSWMRNNGVTQFKLATLAGYGETTINRWLNDHPHPTAEPKIVKALEGLNCPHVAPEWVDEELDDELPRDTGASDAPQMYKPSADDGALARGIASMLTGLPIWRAQEVLRQVETIVKQTPVSIPE